MTDKRTPSSTDIALLLGILLVAARLRPGPRRRVVRFPLRTVPDYSRLPVDALLDELSAANRVRDRRRAKLIKRWLKIKSQH